EPPDTRGYALLEAVCERIHVWEAAWPVGAQQQLFDPAPRKPQMQVRPAERPLVEPAPLVPWMQARLAETSFSPIYQQWLDVREQQLAAGCARLNVKSQRRILLVNGVKLTRFYLSVVDFFTCLHGTSAGIRVTHASYFDDIVEFHEGVASRGLCVASINELMTWNVAAINEFDVVLFIAPSDAMARFMALKGVTAKLVLLDLGLYDQLVESYPGWSSGSGGFFSNAGAVDIIPNKSSQINRVVVYSCQPKNKVT